MVTLYIDLQRRGVNVMVYGLWAGLRHEDPTMTPNLARRLLQNYMASGGDVQVVVDALENALKETGVFGKDDTEGNARPEPTVTAT